MKVGTRYRPMFHISLRVGDHFYCGGCGEALRYKVSGTPNASH